MPALGSRHKFSKWIFKSVVALLLFDALVPGIESRHTVKSTCEFVTKATTEGNGFEVTLKLFEVDGWLGICNEEFARFISDRCRATTRRQVKWLDKQFGIRWKLDRFYKPYPYCQLVFETASYECPIDVLRCFEEGNGQYFHLPRGCFVVSSTRPRHLLVMAS